jgi:lipoate-protein ligase A
VTASSSTPDRLVWEIHRRAGTAGDLHGLDLLGVIADSPDPADPTTPSPLARGVWVLEPTAPAVVLGSAQRFTHGAVAVGRAAVRTTGVEDTTSRPTEVVVRRSGGGAVALGPGVSLWVDVVLPRHDPLWDDDVSKSTQWLGRAWVVALESLGVEAELHTGPTDRDAMARAACFAGMGSGEVAGGGRKLVGISQRRTRAGARFQCVAYTAPPPVDALVALVGGVTGDGDLAAELAGRTGIVPVEPGVLADAVCRAIMSVGNFGQRPTPSAGPPPNR